MERLLKLCQIFGCDLADLLTGSGSETGFASDNPESEMNVSAEEERAERSWIGVTDTAEYGAADSNGTMEISNVAAIRENVPEGNPDENSARNSAGNKKILMI